MIWKDGTILFREFPDTNSYELGIVEWNGSYTIIDVGDFAYGFNLSVNSWTVIGEL